MATARGGENAERGPRLAIVQPGYPGSPRQAQGFLRTLSRHLEEATGIEGIRASYHNLPDEALAALKKEPADVGVVSLGFYLQYRERFGLRARLEAAPEDCFHVVAPKDAAVKTSDLKGQSVAGSPLFESELLRRVVFPGAGGAAAWDGNATLRTSRALRELERGKHRAIVLTGRQYRSLEAIGEMKTLAKIATSDYYPVALVVVFGGSGPVKSESEESEEKLERGGVRARNDKIVRAFKSMKGDVTGKSILETMGCEEFRQVRSQWLEKLEKRYDADKK